MASQLLGALLVWVVALAVVGATPPRVSFVNYTLPNPLPDNVVQLAAMLPSTSTDSYGCFAKSLAMSSQHLLAEVELTPEAGLLLTGTVPNLDVKVQVQIVDSGITPQDGFAATLDAMCYGRNLSTCPSSSILVGPMEFLPAVGSARATPLLQVMQVSTVAPGDIIVNDGLTETVVSVAPSDGREFESIAHLCSSGFNWDQVTLLQPLAFGGFGNTFANPEFTKPGFSTETHFYADPDDLDTVLQTMVSTGTNRVIVLIVGGPVSTIDVINLLFKHGILGTADVAPSGQGWAVVTTKETMDTIASLPPDIRMKAAGIVGLAAYVDSEATQRMAFTKEWEMSVQDFGCSAQQPTQEYALAYDAMSYALLLIDSAVNVARGQGVTSPARDLLRQADTMVMLSSLVHVQGVTGNISVNALGRFTTYNVVNIRPDGSTVVVGRAEGTGSNGVVTGNRVVLQEGAVVWPNGYTATPRDSILNTVTWVPRPGLLTNLFIYSICVIAVAVGFAIAIIWYRKTKIMNWSSPPFCVFILLGPIIDSIPDMLGALHQSTGTLTYVIGCKGLMVTRMFAFVVTFSGVFARTYRIHKLFGAADSMTRTTFPDRKLWAVVGVCVAVFACIHVPWALLAAPTLNQVNAPVPQEPGSELVTTVEYMSCRPTTFSHTFFHWAMITMKLVLLMWGAVLAYRTRRVPEGFNESRYLTICIYNGILFAGLSSPIIHISTDRPDDVLTLSVLANSTPLVFTMFVLFIPKFIAVRQELAGIANSSQYRRMTGASVSAVKREKSIPMLETSHGSPGR